MGERIEKVSSWGIIHHFKILDLGLSLRGTYPELCIRPNLFSDHVSFSLGSTGRSGKKFVPDLIVSTRNLDTPRTLYIEVERTVKKKSRYDERWLAFESDRLVDDCIYFLDDFYNTRRIRSFAESYFSDGQARPEFFLGFVDSSKGLMNSTVTIYKARGQNVSQLNDIFNQLLKGRE